MDKTFQPPVTIPVLKRNTRLIVVGIGEVIVSLVMIVFAYAIAENTFNFRTQRIKEESLNVNTAISQLVTSSNENFVSTNRDLIYSCKYLADLGFNRDFIAFLNSESRFENIVDDCHRILLELASFDNNQITSNSWTDVTKALSDFNDSVNSHMEINQHPRIFSVIFDSNLTFIIYLSFVLGVYYIITGSVRKEVMKNVFPNSKPVTAQPPEAQM
jgi:hypothetical protein